MSANTRIGSQVAGYRLERLLGRGGMSVVYLAEHVRLGRKVALKLCVPPLSEDESFRERFIRESRRAAEIDHPNIVGIYDAGEAEDQLYIAMRYIEGSDLKSVINRDGQLNLGRSLFILEQAASALQAAHERDLIHRDVKPANILVEDGSDRVYLTDFGVVKHTATRGLTKTGVFIGTLEYAAPEQIEGLTVDARTDIYALGCVLYEMLAGKPPYAREADVAVMHAHLTEPPPILTEARPDLPKALNRVIQTAMAKDKEERYSSCDEFAMAARGASLQRQPTSGPVTVGPGSPTVVSRGESAGMETPAAAGITGMSGELGQPTVAQMGAGQPTVAQTGTGEGGLGQGTGAGVAPPPPPAESQVGGTDGRGGLRTPFGRFPWLFTIALVVLASAASALTAYFLTRGGGSSASTTSTSTSTGAVTNLASLSPAKQLQAVISPDVYQACTPSKVPASGAEATAVCLAANSSKPQQFFPDRAELSIYKTDADLLTAYKAERSKAGITKRNYGVCNGIRWGGEGTWIHGPSVTKTGKPHAGGHRFCTFLGNDAVIVWTHEQLAQPTHVPLLGIARQGGSAHDTLFNWWTFWHHKLGKAG